MGARTEEAHPRNLQPDQTHGRMEKVFRNKTGTRRQILTR